VIRAKWIGHEAAGCGTVGFLLVRTVILDPPSAGLDELVQRRARSGLDRLDEIWEGEGP
jgi:hypothetical protein